MQSVDCVEISQITQDSTLLNEESFPLDANISPLDLQVQKVAQNSVQSLQKEQQNKKSCAKFVFVWLIGAWSHMFFNLGSVVGNAQAKQHQYLSMGGMAAHISLLIFQSFLFYYWLLPDFLSNSKKTD